jgi:oxalate decarboxylase
MDNGDSNKGKMPLSRREVLGLGIAGAAASVVPAHAAPDRNKHHEPLAGFKYDIESREGWVGPGGSAKEATVDEFPVSESMAGVSMRLKPGGLRELHWHAIAAEWALVLNGNVRTTVIAPDGQAEQTDFAPGDVWYFPKGHGHALQCLGPGDAHFVLVFDDGHFSEFGTFSITDWIARTPPEIVARNLGLSPAAIATLPKSEAYIVPDKVPPPIAEDLRNGSPEWPHATHKFRLGASKPRQSCAGGEIRLVTSKEFPIQTTLSAALEDLQPGAVREMHWHPNADEWQYYISGHSRVTIFGAHGRAATEEFRPGQIAFIRQGFGHYVEQSGSEPTRFLAMFNSPVYEEISISGWLGANPPAMLADNFGLTSAQVAALPKQPLVFFK